MGEKKSSGCLTALVVVVVIAALGFVGLFSLFFKRVSRGREYAAEVSERVGLTVEAGSAGTVVFQEGADIHFPPHQSGEELSREQFISLMIDDHATELARKAFQRTADGAAVKWMLQTQDISESNGKLEGRFSLPWEIRSAHGSRGSSVNLTCEFSEEGRDSLLKVRRGDWVVVEGRLSFDGHQSAILDARIFDESAPLRAERP